MKILVIIFDDAARVREISQCFSKSSFSPKLNYILRFNLYFKSKFTSSVYGTQ